MQMSEVSSRYAKALFDIATEDNCRKEIFEELRAIQKGFNQDKAIYDFITSTAIKPEEKKNLLKTAFGKTTINEKVKSFLFLLADRDRLQIFDQIVNSYQQTSDEAYGVTRGSVRSAQPLSEDDQRAIEDRIESAMGRKVILHYVCDPSVIGGLIAEVGGFVFDDTIITHLRRLKEDIKRRAH